jgi:molybdate transport system substrate-binding protein
VPKNLFTSTTVMIPIQEGPNEKQNLLGSDAVATTFSTRMVATGSALANDLKLLASDNAGIRSALTEFVPRFEASTGHRVRMDFAPVVTMKRRIDAGETFDVVIGPGVGELLMEGKVVADSQAAFARDGLSVGVPKGAPKPDISSVDAFKRTLLNAKSIGYSQSGQPGILFFQVLDRLGIAQDLRPKLRGLEPDDLPKAIERHELEIVVTSSTAILSQLA